MDKIDEYLLKEHGVIAGACSSIESIKYQIAREVYLKAIDKACKLLEKDLFDLYDRYEEINYVCSGSCNSKDEFINKFKKEMKGDEK